MPLRAKYVRLCRAHNKWFRTNIRDQYWWTLNTGGIYAGAPKPAKDVSVSGATSNSVVVKWKQTSRFESVLIRYRMMDGGTDIMCHELYDKTSVERLTVSGLSQGTDYEFYVSFVNRGWCSHASGPHYVSTGYSTSSLPSAAFLPLSVCPSVIVCLTFRKFLQV